MGGGLRKRAIDALVLGAGIVRTVVIYADDVRRRLTGTEPRATDEPWPTESAMVGERLGPEEPDPVIVPESYADREPEEAPSEAAEDWEATVNGGKPSHEDEGRERGEEEPSERAETPLAAPPSQRASLRDEVELRFVRTSDSATLPERAHDGDAGLDLFAAEAARIGPSQRVSVGTGVAVAIPEGHAGLVVPRSGLALRHGVALVNAPGLIDSGYRGELRVLLLNTDHTSEFRVAVGDRIAQLLLVPVAVTRPMEADQLETTLRGAGGFGSTGA